MGLLVTGSIGIDTVTTPFGVSENCLGGSSVYFSLAASNFSPVRFVGAIGPDCPFNLHQIFSGRNIDLTGLETRSFSRTFRWKGSYLGSMNHVITENIELNVLAEAPPDVPQKFRDSKFVFLANTTPSLQIQLLEQVNSPEFAAADTMECWIHGHAEDLRKLLKKINCLIVNKDEAKLLSGCSNLIEAGEKIIAMGPSVVVVKKGESGSLMFNNKSQKFLLPAYPAKMIKDPTGAGDSFAGGFMGYIASCGKTDWDTLKRAVVYGTVMASYAIADFSVNGLVCASNSDINNRFDEFRAMMEL